MSGLFEWRVSVICVSRAIRWAGRQKGAGRRAPAQSVCVQRSASPDPPDDDSSSPPGHEKGADMLYCKWQIYFLFIHNICRSVKMASVSETQERTFTEMQHTSIHNISDSMARRKYWSYGSIYWLNTGYTIIMALMEQKHNILTRPDTSRVRASQNTFRNPCYSIIASVCDAKG